MDQGWLVVPVPLHRWRLWRRGFNQAAVLAGEIAKARGAISDAQEQEYVRSLIEEDVAEGSGKPVSRFASSDLAGLYEGSGKAVTNQEVRNRLRRGR